MPAELKQGTNKLYLNILLSSGELIQSVDKGTEKCRYREAKNPKTGEVKVKYDLVYDNCSGKVT